MAKIFVEGLDSVITVEDAPDFEEACAMISGHEDGALIVFPDMAGADCAVLKSRLIMFVQSKEQPKARQYVIPTKESTTAAIKKTRKKRARSTGVQEKDSQ